jgi:asparagine synthase (glutamine-hydrolysing)
MWLMARVIKSMGIKWYFLVKELMNFWGYLYFTKRQMQENSTKRMRKLGKLHMYDCLRANKSLAAGELKVVPFLIKNLWMCHAHQSSR